MTAELHERIWIADKNRWEWKIGERNPFPSTGQLRLENPMETAASPIAYSLPLAKSDATDTPFIPVTVLVNPDLIANAIIGALEGASTSWLKNFRCKENAVENPAQPWYSDPRVWCRAFVVEATYDLNDDGSQTKTKTLTLYDLVHGLHLMATKAPSHFGDLLAENDDAVTHDEFMQYFVMGESVFG